MDTDQLPPVGTLLREWRRRRNLSQLDLALQAGTSPRHLSCVETGRARPSRSMVLRLAEQLDVPMRERNTLLLATGYAPAYRESPLGAERMAAVRGALKTLLAGHDPYPAVLVDRGWDVLDSNRAMSLLLESVPEHLTRPTANVMRLILHSDGLASQCLNFPEVRLHAISRLRDQVKSTGDPVLRALYDEVSAYGPPHGEDGTPPPEWHSMDVIVPLRLRTPYGELSLFSTIATFGAPADVTLSELAVESFFPSDEQSGRILHRLAESN